MFSTLTSLTLGTMSVVKVVLAGDGLFFTLGKISPLVLGASRDWTVETTGAVVVVEVWLYAFVLGPVADDVIEKVLLPEDAGNVVAAGSVTGTCGSSYLNRYS